VQEAASEVRFYEPVLGYPVLTVEQVRRIQTKMPAMPQGRLRLQLQCAKTTVV
jgi:hypothetical protein